MLIPLIATVSPQLSDAAIHELVNAQLGVLGLIVVLAFIVFFARPLIASNRKDGVDSNANLKALIEQNAETQKDNRRLIDIVSKLADGIAENSKHIAALQITDTQRIQTDALIVTKIGKVGEDVTALPPFITQTSAEAIQEVKETMTQAFAVRDDRFQQLSNILEDVKRKVDTNETVNAEIKSMLGEVLSILREARPIELHDTGTLPALPTDKPLDVNIVNMPELPVEKPKEE